MTMVSNSGAPCRTCCASSCPHARYPSALGDDVRHAAGRALSRREILHRLVDLLPLGVGAVLDVGAEQTIEKQVAVVLGRAAALEREHRAQAQPRADRRHAAAAVRLQRAARDQRVRILRERFADEEFELSDLVARLQQAREVVSLHPELDAELGGESLELEQRRRRRGELDTRDRWNRCRHPVHYLRQRGRLARPDAVVRAAASASARYAPDSRDCCC